MAESEMGKRLWHAGEGLIFGIIFLIPSKLKQTILVCLGLGKLFQV